MDRNATGKQYRCHVCGAVGHNRRSCGKAEQRKLSAANTPVVSSAGKNSHTGGATLESAYEKYDNLAYESSGAPNDSVEDSSAREPMTGKEMVTWWALLNGKTGKRGTSGTQYGQTTHIEWSKHDTTQLLSLLNTAVEDNVPDRDIRQFLRIFGSFPKTEIARAEGTPKKILTILATDKNVDVRIEIAGRPHLPRSIGAILADDDNYNVRR